MYVAKTLKELDVSDNRFNWQQSTGEFDSAMRVLASLRVLRELRLSGNPISGTPGLRYLLITYNPRLQRVDGVVVSEHERRGNARLQWLALAAAAPRLWESAPSIRIPLPLPIQIQIQIQIQTQIQIQIPI
ncbi:MAG: hypothetical protein SGPRY_003809 [Prymnesium sp.]